MFIDQPLGIGFSTYVEGALAINASMYKEYFKEFFLKWLEIESFQRFKGHPLYLAGDSYAGHYIPHIATRLNELNNNDINLVGIALGNPWISASIQYQSLLQFTVRNKLISDVYIPEIAGYSGLCNSLIESKNARLAISAQDICYKYMNSITSKIPDFNQYDIRTRCKDNVCYEIQKVIQFFNREDVQDELGVNQAWQFCDMRIGKVLAKEDEETSTELQLEQLLNEGIRVLVYVGVFDWLCNIDGIERVLSSLNWIAKTSWNNAIYKKCNYGLCKETMNLRLIRFDNAGHLVPHDQPQLSIEMINEFIAENN